MSTNNSRLHLVLPLVMVAAALAAPSAFAATTPVFKGTCDDLTNALKNEATPLIATTATGIAGKDLHQALWYALNSVLKGPAGTGAGVVDSANTGIGNPMWATLVSRDGKVCAVAAADGSVASTTANYALYKTGVATPASSVPMGAWQMSRIISAQKASTAAALSSNKMALSTANLYAAAQPGGSLSGLLHQANANQAALYKHDIKKNGLATDSMKGLLIGGVNVFGGGLPLYGKVDGVSTGTSNVLLGGLGVSGDYSCTDHSVAWAVHQRLGLGKFPTTSFSAVGGNSISGYADNIIYDMSTTLAGATGMQATGSASGWGHPKCATGNIAPTSTSN